MKSLLPPNATDLEKKLAEIGSDAFNLPSIKLAKDVDHAPSDFLAYLAWERQVNYWRDEWPDALKRHIINQAISQHKIKGTPAAIKRALEPFGFEVKLIEWFQMDPPGKPGTFALELDLVGKELSEETYHEVNRLVEDSKAATRHVSNVQISSNPVLYINTAIALQDAVTIECMPQGYQ
ncbi:phage tail protein I [Acinetobacter baumannii]|uniref:phage tail protein I n=1 Tax=Acinetobacter TaxID=469 RepID=UPI0002D11F64|nr:MULTISPECIES: phage tail protein I [Acinetobacter]EKV7758345.1 phage tail protein I [Acinetobacter baumannii]EKW8719318.1 phage tail protein I [Acinetobacter baumannii]ELB7302053.1 phage tail protein I [Acinetobacter baumannii]ENW33608.1 phage tail protein I [Acinetobacter baumannii NIPH 201]MBD0452355.1 phage tail protein I [Acinetobacter baumannii]